MTGNSRHTSLIPNGWRVAGWGSAAMLLLLPAIAMQFTKQVNWSPADFLFAAILFTTTGLAAEGAVRLSGTWSRLIGFAFAIFASFATVWSNLAVGIIGNEQAEINVGFFALLLAGIIAAGLVRLRSRAMAHIAGLLAVSQPLMGVAATHMMRTHAVEWGVLMFFAALWLASSIAFRIHARSKVSAG